MGYLALLADPFNKNNGGDPNDPVSYEALNKAYSVMDNNLHSIFAGSPNECRALAESSDGLISIDMDGQLMKWDYNGSGNAAGILSYSSSINFISCNANGSSILTGHDNAAVCLWDRKSGAT